MCAKGRPIKEAAESIHIIEHYSICATGRPKRGCRKHIYDTELCMC